MPRLIPELKFTIKKKGVKKRQYIELFRAKNGLVRMKVDNKWFKNKMTFKLEKFYEIFNSKIQREMK